jgi:hypothetical protein
MGDCSSRNHPAIVGGNMIDLCVGGLVFLILNCLLLMVEVVGDGLD